MATGDASKATAEPISLDAFFKVSKESFENQPEMEPDLVQHKCIGRQENHPASTPRHIDSGDDRWSCPYDPTLRDHP